MIASFLSKFQESVSDCKECGKKVHIIILKGRPFFFNDDLSEHTHGKDHPKNQDEIRREAGGTWG
jgi:hypothetical protein